MPPVVPSVVEGSQPIVGIDPTNKVVEVSPNMLSSVLAKRKHDDGVGVSGCKKSKAPSSLQAMREAARLMLSSGCPSNL